MTTLQYMIEIGSAFNLHSAAYSSIGAILFWRAAGHARKGDKHLAGEYGMIGIFHFVLAAS